MTLHSRSLLLAALAAVSIQAQAVLNVVACEPEWAALATELGGDKLKVSSTTTALQDPHHIEARPSLIARMRGADLLVCTGMELEVGWLPVLLQQSANTKLASGAPGNFEAGRFVTPLDVPARLDRSDGDVHAAGNPHIQLDPRNILKVAAALSERLGQIDAANAPVYRDRFRSFASRWSEATRKWEQQAQPLRGLPVVARHKNMTYLWSWLGVREVATLEPKPGVEPNGGQLSLLKTQLAAQPAKMVVRGAYEDPRASRWLSEQAGIPEVVLPFTVGGNDKAADLFGLFDSTLSLLLAAAK
ncbi:MAG: zinc ABC transporter substrate-binding protein [Burkholderiales bacterium]|nr:zinc ABC transporter substrate-binding protein [Burkholderiales bacterium]